MVLNPKFWNMNASSTAIHNPTHNHHLQFEIPKAELIFFVREDGTACREQVPKVIRFEIPEDLRPRKLKFCVEWDIERDDAFETSFAASKNPDGSWTVRNVP